MLLPQKSAVVYRVLYTGTTLALPASHAKTIFPDQSFRPKARETGPLQHKTRAYISQMTLLLNDPASVHKHLEVRFAALSVLCTDWHYAPQVYSRVREICKGTDQVTVTVTKEPTFTIGTLLGPLVTVPMMCIAYMYRNKVLSNILMLPNALCLAYSLTKYVMTSKFANSSLNNVYFHTDAVRFCRKR